MNSAKRSLKKYYQNKIDIEENTKGGRRRVFKISLNKIEQSDANIDNVLQEIDRLLIQLEHDDLDNLHFEKAEINKKVQNIKSQLLNHSMYKSLSLKIKKQKYENFLFDHFEANEFSFENPNKLQSHCDEAKSSIFFIFSH